MSHANMIRWDTCEADFRCDGRLRDIYIAPGTLADWQGLYPFLRDYSDVEYLLDGVAEAPPDSVEEVFALRSSGSPLLRLKVGRAVIVFHFFCEDQVECDFAADEVASQADLDALLGFIRQLGELTHKRVAITQENGQGFPIITYEPESGSFQHHEDGQCQPHVLPPEDSALWWQAYLDAFIDTSKDYFRRHIASPRQFSDGVHHTGYLWDCLRSPSRITFQRFSLELVRHPEVLVLADDHSRDLIPGARLWPYPAYSVARFKPQALLDSLETLPEDLYVFDSSLSWTLVLTHENDGKRRICCAVGIEA